MALYYTINIEKCRETFRKLRLERELTLEQAGEIFGISRFTYANYESGRSELTIEILIKVCNYYQLDISRFIENCAFGTNTALVLEGLSAYERNVIIDVDASLRKNRTSKEQDMDKLYNELKSQSKDDEELA